MNQPPDNLYELLRRAIMTQIELGGGEVVVDHAHIGELRQAMAAKMQSSRQVSVSDALSTTTGGATAFQGSVSHNERPSFGSLDEHRKAICDCQLCPLGQTRTKFVYGVGNPDADLMFVGEAPGADEDRFGEPFVGRAGKLLDQILVAMKLSREQVYIANILKCRPPGNRDPLPDEMNKCFPYLREQIHLVRPRLLCALGRIAGQALLQTTTPLGKLRGRWHEYEGVPMLVTYHPAALLRFQQYKKDTWADMQLIMARLKELT
jgi:uracil-DNA glycosylase family 4